MGRLTTLDSGYRAMLPSRRTIETVCTEPDLMYHATWRSGQLGDLVPGAAPRADIRIHVACADLVQLADGSLPFRDAYARQRVRLEASMTDLLRLRAVL